MENAINTRRNGHVAILEINNAPVNALSNAVRAGLSAAVAAAQADAGVAAIVILGAGRAFSGGAEIREFGAPMGLPGLPDLVAQVEASTKPVVAAIHGVAFGGGLELPLGCHFRLADANAKFALPEVKLGLLPGAGGTQRLPRLIGLVKAVRMIVSGDAIGAPEALALGLIDRVAEGELEAAAVAFAEKVVAEKTPLRRLSTLEVPRKDAEAFEAEATSLLKRARGLDAPAACIEAVRNVLTLPFTEGMKAEREGFMRLRDGNQSKAQRHLFFAERAALKVSGVPAGTKARKITKVAVLGAGTMGGGIAMCFASAGIPVTMIDPNAEALARGHGIIEANYRATQKRGGLSETAVNKALALLTPSASMDSTADCDLVIEAVFEDMALKKRIFADLDRLTRPGTILASNTSTLDVNAIAQATSRPQDVCGMHFFSPANIMKLLEIVRGAKTAPDVIQTTIEIGKAIAKVPVVVGVCYGFVGNRMLHARSPEVERLLLEGASPAQIDKAATDFGFAMGPCAVSDLAGLDVGWRIRKERGTTAAVADAICELGRYGQKTGAGYFRYEPGTRTPLPDPVIDALIERIAGELQVRRRVIAPEEILERLVFPLVNEGARILEEGIAERASDIDLIWVNGYGWPIGRGGPMFYADQIGLKLVAERLNHYAEATRNPRLKAAPLLEHLAAEGKGFADFTRA